MAAVLTVVAAAIAADAQAVAAATVEAAVPAAATAVAAIPAAAAIPVVATAVAAAAVAVRPEVAAMVDHQAVEDIVAKISLNSHARNNTNVALPKSRRNEKESLCPFVVRTSFNDKRTGRF